MFGWFELVLCCYSSHSPSQSVKDGVARDQLCLIAKYNTILYNLFPFSPTSRHLEVPRLSAFSFRTLPIHFAVSSSRVTDLCSFLSRIRQGGWDFFYRIVHDGYTSFYRQIVVITKHDNVLLQRTTTRIITNLRQHAVWICERYLFLQFTTVQTSDLTLKLSKTHLKMHKQRALIT